MNKDKKHHILLKVKLKPKVLAVILKNACDMDYVYIPYYESQHSSV